MTTGRTCDASALVAVLVDGGAAGAWASGELSAAGNLFAPHLAVFETANILRRHELAQVITADQAAQAHADLVALPIDLWPYELLAQRAWQLRANLSVYDGAYVALAELTKTTLVTLDTRIARAPNVRCTIATPPGL
jgi:predicted nucleic acid-binding protein